MRQGSLADLAVLLTITSLYIILRFASGKHKATTDLHRISYFISYGGGGEGDSLGKSIIFWTHDKIMLLLHLQQL